MTRRKVPRHDKERVVTPISFLSPRTKRGVSSRGAVPNEGRDASLRLAWHTHMSPRASARGLLMRCLTTFGMTRGKGMPHYVWHDKGEGDASHSLGMTYSIPLCHHSITLCHHSITLCHHSITLCHPERSEGSPHEIPRNSPAFARDVSE